MTDIDNDDSLPTPTVFYSSLKPHGPAPSILLRSESPTHDLSWLGRRGR